MRKLAGFVVGMSMSVSAMAHRIPLPPPVPPVVSVVPEVLPVASSGINWVPFVAVTSMIGYAIYKVHQCDKKPLTDKCHPVDARRGGVK